MVNYVKMDLPHVTVKAWKLHSGKAGLVGGTLLIYLCVEGTLRYYWWVTIASLLMSLSHDLNLAGFAWLTQAEITNKGHVSEGFYYPNGSVLKFLRKPLLSCCAHECYRGTCWDCSGKNCNKSCSKSMDVCMCDVLLQHKSGHIRHLHQKHGSLTLTSLRASTEGVYSTSHVTDVRPAVFVAHSECPCRAQPHGRGIFW